MYFPRLQVGAGVGARIQELPAEREGRRRLGSEAEGERGGGGGERRWIRIGRCRPRSTAQCTEDGQITSPYPMGLLRGDRVPWEYGQRNRVSGTKEEASEW